MTPYLLAGAGYGWGSWDKVVGKNAERTLYNVGGGVRYDLTKAFELDGQQTSNEPGSYAIRSAIELGVAELIKSGERKGLWHYKTTEQTTAK